MRLPEHLRRAVGLHQRRVGDLRIADPFRRIAPRDPEKLVLENRIPPVGLRLRVREHLPEHPGDVRVRDLFNVPKRDFFIRLRALGEHVAVEIDFLEVGENRLPVLHDGQGGADLRDIVLCMFRIVQDKVREVDECVVIDPSGQVFARKLGALKALFDARPLRGQRLFLGLGDKKLQLLDVIEGIADLVPDPERDQDVRVEVRIHVGVQVRAELALPEDVGLHHRLLEIKPVILGLAHEGLRDRGDRGLALDRPVRVDVGDLGVPEPENENLPILRRHIAGQGPADDLHPVLIEAEREPAHLREVGDQIPGAVVGGFQHIVHGLPLHKELHDDILFLVEIQTSEVFHGPSH